MKVIVQDSTWAGRARGSLDHKERDTEPVAVTGQEGRELEAARDERTCKMDHNDRRDNICKESSARSPEEGGSRMRYRSGRAFERGEVEAGRRA